MGCVPYSFRVSLKHLLLLIEIIGMLVKCVITVLWGLLVVLIFHLWHKPLELYAIHL